MSKQQFLKHASGMPALKHSVDGQFSYRDSEVVKWLSDSEAARRLLFDLARHGRAIEFDKISGLWRGIPCKAADGEMPTIDEIVSVFEPGEWLGSLEILARCYVRHKKTSGMWRWNLALRTLHNRGILQRHEKSKLYHVVPKKTERVGHGSSIGSSPGR